MDLLVHCCYYTMIYPPDDLLADLQSSIPPESRQSGGSRTYDQLPELPGTETNEKQKEIFEVPPGYDAPALSDEEEQVGKHS